MIKRLFQFLFGQKKETTNVHFATGSMNGMTLEEATGMAKDGFYICRMSWSSNVQLQTHKLLWNPKHGLMLMDKRWSNSMAITKYEPSPADRVSSDWLCCGKVGV